MKEENRQYRNNILPVFVLKEKKYKLLHENISKLLKNTNQKV
jgi:hypothetical protein